MKTKYIITGFMGAALLAAPMAKANSIGLEIIANGTAVYDDVQPTSTGNETFTTGTTVVNGWTVYVSSVTYPALGGGTLTSPYLDTLAFSASTASGGTLEIIFAGNGYQSGGQEGLMELNGNGRGDFTGTYSAYYNTANTVQSPVSSTETGASLIAAGDWGGSQINYQESGPVNADVPYTLTQDITITSVGGANVSFDASLSVPDGGLTLTMLGAAMVGLAAVRSKLGRLLPN
jgi:hypothetical protein